MKQHNARRPDLRQLRPDHPDMVLPGNDDGSRRPRNSGESGNGALKQRRPADEIKKRFGRGLV